MHYTADPRDQASSGAGEAALAACRAGIESYNLMRADPMLHLDAAIEADEGFALPRLVKAWILHSVRDARHAGAIRALLASAEAGIDGSGDRDRTYLAALKLALSGHEIESATMLDAFLDRRPTDLLAHRLLQFELFWNGRSHWMREVAERAAPHWNEGVEGYATFLACRAFSNGEAGCHRAAEVQGRAAVDLDPGEPWGAHAVAHVLFMQGRHDEGIAWLEALSPGWGAANQIRHHLWWHLCLFLFERGAHERILSLLTSEMRNPDSPLVREAPEATIDIQNVASTLLRLELRGVDTGGHWAVFAEACARRVHDHANAFCNVHDMMVLGATGQFDEAEELLRSLGEYLKSGEGSLATAYHAAGLAACEAVLAHRKKEYLRVVELLSPVRHDLPRIGGSHAQRELLYQLLIDASRRSGRGDRVAVYLNDLRRIGFDKVEERTLYRDADPAG